MSTVKTVCTLLLCLSVVGCKPTYKTTVPSYEAVKKQVLAAGPHVKDKVEDRENFLKGGSVAPVKSGTEVTINSATGPKQVKWGSLVLDDKKVAEYAAIKSERDRLRKDLETERIKAKTKEILYKASVAALAERGKRTWWENNKGVVALTIGGTLGAALIVGLVYALTGGKGATVTSTHILLPSKR